MKNLVWFLLGIAGGFVLAHFMNKDPRGHEILADVDARITEFTDRIGDAYREQEARFAGIVDDVRDAAAEAAGAVRTVASDAVDTVADAAKSAADTLGD
ncbi:MAG: ATPase [Microbacterium sp.]|uniref:ATPase n=1 Tax=Microbacterium sp. TaxID=51671 RepID=UPI003F7EC6C4